MGDLVLNHVSKNNKWFQEFLNGNPKYEHYFKAFDTHPPKEVIDQIRRARSHPLFTPFETSKGKKYVWTTFSDYQIDVNIDNPEVFLELIDINLRHILEGVRIIRHDAITYLGKEFGTECANHPKNYVLLNLFRDITRAVAPSTSIISETNVPHHENISYFGHDEQPGADMVYNFAFPPLLFHTFISQDTSALVNWEKTLGEGIPAWGTYFNFIDSHDGMGIWPADMLSEEQKQALLRRTEENGGKISTKATADGEVPYEMNITWWNALNGDYTGDELQVPRFIASGAIQFALSRGIPAIYLPRMFGTENNYEGFKRTGWNRTLNHHNLNEQQIYDTTKDTSSKEGAVFHALKSMLKARNEEPAFHPHGSTQHLDDHNSVYATLRRSPDGQSAIIPLVNATDKPQPFELRLDRVGLKAKALRDIVTGKEYDAGTTFSKTLKPYEFAFLKPAK